MGKHYSKRDKRRNVTFKMKQQTLENSIKKLNASKKKWTCMRKFKTKSRRKMIQTRMRNNFNTK